jgi:hypothetical protein
VNRNVSESVSFETTREHYGVWRWRLELDPSRTLVNSWARIGASSLEPASQFALANVAWALASFERAYNVLLEDIIRAERARNIGVPPVMAFLTGPYQASLDYLLVQSLWMDLGDVFVAYRTIRHRFRLLEGPVRREQPPWSKADLEREIARLKARTLPELNPKPVTELADEVLHEKWQPGGAQTLESLIYWKGVGTGNETLDFAQADFRGSLARLVGGDGRTGPKVHH